MLLGGFGTPILFVISFFFIVIGILWVLLPFSMFGIKAKLDEQTKVLQRIDERLHLLQRALRQKAADRSARGDTDEPSTLETEEFDAPEKTLNAESAGNREDEENNPVPHHRWQRPE
jgi:hypothetical protein